MKPEESDTVSRILWLESESSSLEPRDQDRMVIEQAVFTYAHQFLDSVEETKAYNTDLSISEIIDQVNIPDEPAQLDHIIDVYQKAVDTPGLNPASGGHLGYIPGGGIYTAALGDYLAAVGNRYAGIYYGSPGAVRMEHKLIRWMTDLFGYGEEAGGTLCSGGSIANLIAICAARDSKEYKPSVYERLVVYMSDQTHHCVDKALRIAGLEYAIVRRIPLDASQKMKTHDLRKQVEQDLSEGLIPWLTVASAGTTDTGAIDPMEDIAALCANYGIWLHIDAAYGGFFILTEQELFQGIEKADSIVVDPHKGLFLPYGLGAVIVKNQKHLLRTNYYLANYMQDAYASELPLSPADISPELTRHFRALRLWLPLQIHGLNVFRHSLEEKLLLARYAAKKLLEFPFTELKTYPELSVVCFRICPPDTKDPVQINAANLELIEFIKQDGKVFLSSTNLHGEVYIRMAILCFRTHLRTVDYALEQIETFCRRYSNHAS